MEPKEIDVKVHLVLSLYNLALAQIEQLQLQGITVGL